MSKMERLLDFGSHFAPTPPTEKLPTLEGWQDNSSCLENHCVYDSFGVHNNRVCTSDIPIYQALVSACAHTDDPKQADRFLIPIGFGTSSVLGWDHLKKSQRAKEIGRIERDALSILSRSTLEHFNNETAGRHVFLYTNEVQFLFGLISGFGSAIFRSLVVHLGDDRFLIGPRPARKRQQMFELTRGLTVQFMSI